MYIEYNNLYKEAESRGITPLDILEALHVNGRKIYLCFAEDQLGTMDFGNSAQEDDEPYEFQIHGDMLGEGIAYPITPESRVELANALGKGNEPEELKVVEGIYTIKVKVDLPSNLVINYNDFQFLPPPFGYKPTPVTVYPAPPENNFFEKFEKIYISNKRKPHSAFVVVAKTMMKIKRAEAWKELVDLAQKSRGQTEVTLSGWGKIYLRRVRLNPEQEILYSHEQFDYDKTENLPDGVKKFTIEQFQTCWTDFKKKSHEGSMKEV